MLPKYADIIIDISHEAIDRTFQYKVPEHLNGCIGIGTQVSIPFGRGNHLRSGYIVGFSDNPLFDEEKIKEIDSVKEGGVAANSELIAMAAYIKEQYGSTMSNALKTVMPIKEKVKGLINRQIRLVIPIDEVEEKLVIYQKKNAKAKYRLLSELVEESILPYNLVVGKLNISTATLTAMKKEGVIAIEEETYYRDVLPSDYDGIEGKQLGVVPNEEQQAVISRIVTDYQDGNRGTYLLKGVTGSGKTLVYIEVIKKIVEMGKQAIVLIPEIALTYQTVKRFRHCFGNKVTIMNSRLSKGERYDQFEKAKRGEVSVMIGPRSALFTPFPNLGIIVMDEEHEATYKSDYPPKYHAREVAIWRAKQCNACVLLGSATPSVESYYHAIKGEYQLLELTKRANENAKMADVQIVDLREELKSGNRSIFSNYLKEKIGDRLNAGQQTMLFINRRGYAGFISCRSCGHVFKCPHCDVSLTEHFKGTTKEKLVCHYCGYETVNPKLCPECGSPFIAGFGIGTQKVEEMVKKEFPAARVLRMDMDTTKQKDAHEKILSAFANGEADILVGTQMIVKGHDFSNVTLVGMIAADLTLFDNDYKSGERTFDLLTQAAGRAGRGSLPGEVVIQTYNPEHYCIQTAAKQDYQSFYMEEKAYRSMLKYPPFCHVLAVFMEHENYEVLVNCCNKLKGQFDIWNQQLEQKVMVIGPCDATITKVNDKYRRVIYLKQVDYEKLVWMKNQTEQWNETNEQFKQIRMTFDFDPMHSY
ncbi:MAG: primosomal protein N' [Eubacteriales bacterium]|nr:primosomal protein N' [Eubacteriales bacterium]